MFRCKNHQRYEFAKDSGKNKPIFKKHKDCRVPPVHAVRSYQGTKARQITTQWAIVRSCWELEENNNYLGFKQIFEKSEKENKNFNDKKAGLFPCRCKNYQRHRFAKKR